LKDRYQSGSGSWTIRQGSVLEKTFLSQFGQVDVVYSWGVLHHTGNMREAFENAAKLVKDGGRLFIAIYNDQGGPSRRWHWIKKKYNEGNCITKFILSVYTLFRQWTVTFIRDFLKSGNPCKSWVQYGRNNRGMSAWYDLIDWVGGYPFEVAKPEEVFDFFKSRGFRLERLKTCAGGLGCNEFVFVKEGGQ